MKILAVSDVELAYLRSPAIMEKFSKVALIVSCGDLPFDYLEYIADGINATLYYVLGNHQASLESSEGKRFALQGGINLNGRFERDPSGLILAGLDGCLRYNYGSHQYSQSEMWWKAIKLLPKLYSNKLRYGRFLDVLVTHAAPWKLNDLNDQPHQGFKAFQWLIKNFHPILHLHGHIHLYRQDAKFQTQFMNTCVMNTYGYREINIHLPEGKTSGKVGTFELIRKGF
jgi:Icc-related predicted phosphoesterase